jgi:hypothetical protein
VCFYASSTPCCRLGGSHGLERFLVVSQVSDGVQQLDVSQVRAATAAGPQTAATAAAAVALPQATLMCWLKSAFSKQCSVMMLFCHQHAAGTQPALQHDLQLQWLSTNRQPAAPDNTLHSHFEACLLRLHCCLAVIQVDSDLSCAAAEAQLPPGAWQKLRQLTCHCK